MRQNVNFLPILMGFLLVIIYFVILYTLLNLNNKKKSWILDKNFDFYDEKT